MYLYLRGGDIESACFSSIELFKNGDLEVFRMLQRYGFCLEYGISKKNGEYILLKRSYNSYTEPDIKKFLGDFYYDDNYYGNNSYSNIDFEVDNTFQYEDYLISNSYQGNY